MGYLVIPIVLYQSFILLEFTNVYNRFIPV